MKKKPLVASIQEARQKRDESKIDIYAVGADGLETMMRDAILEKLGPDRDALKAFDVTAFIPENAEQIEALNRIGGKMFVAKGALALDDSGINMRVFSVNIEEGMSERQDREVADALAHQCLICVAQMKRERKSLPGMSVATG